jgi:hypothetical protein
MGRGQDSHCAGMALYRSCQLHKKPQQIKKETHMKTYRLKASSIQNYEMMVKAKSEDEAYEYASLNSWEWREIPSEDWQDEGCEEVIDK